MKRSVLNYRKVGEHNVRLLSFENVATPMEIRTEFGRKVYEGYFHQSYPRYSRMNKVSFIINFTENSFPIVYTTGDIVTMETFSILVSAMKKAGSTLALLKEDYKEPTQKVVI